MSTDPSADRRPVILIIRDGWGENPNSEHDPFNAVRLARTPVDDRLRREWPFTLIRTSGEDVGLPAGTMGNSEVGHQNIGAGRIVDQEIMRITRAIRDESFFQNEALRGAIEHARANNANIHIMGLVSDGRVHSDLEHLIALIELLRRERFPGERAFIHCFTDGRDTGPKTGLGFIERLESAIASSHPDPDHRPRIASVIGRYWAMDRDHRWERIRRAYACLTDGLVADSPALDGGGRVEGDLKSASTIASKERIQTARNAREAVAHGYDNPTDSSRSGDEFIEPTQIISAEGIALPRIADHDAVIFFNFRGDRPRQLTKAFVLDDDDWANVQAGGFDRVRKLDNLFFCTMTGYEAGLPVSALAFRKPPKMENILGRVIADAGLTQFRCAETEKFAHVTYFFNDYREPPFEGETRVLCPSPQDVNTYDQKPEMSAHDVCDTVVERLKSKECDDLFIINFANPDMVGHTGSLEATTRAVEVVDECVGRIIDAALAVGGELIITADHGNAEQMWDPEHDSPHTAHTAYDVPLLIVGERFSKSRLREGGRLADIAPTILSMMKIEHPPEMTGGSLIEAPDEPRMSL